MKLSSSSSPALLGLDSSFSSFGSRKRYRWYIFSDLVLICRPNRLREGFREKMRVPLDRLRVHMAEDGDGFSIHVQHTEVKSFHTGASFLSDKESTKYECWAVDENGSPAIVEKLGGLQQESWKREI